MRTREEDAEKGSLLLEQVLDPDPERRRDGGQGLQAALENLQATRKHDRARGESGQFFIQKNSPARCANTRPSLTNPKHRGFREWPSIRLPCSCPAFNPNPMPSPPSTPGRVSRPFAGIPGHFWRWAGRAACGSGCTIISYPG